MTDPSDGATGATRTSAPTADQRGPMAPASSANAGPLLPRRDAGRYQIVAEHGRGGLGRVYRAFDTELGRDVAIKELLKRSYRAESRFLREALITARLEHPAIVPIHEAGRWTDGTPYYAMKLVSGQALSALMTATAVEGRLALLSHVVAVADAIAYAHARGIVHRDLKPANIIVGEFGETVVIDWGLAKDLRQHAADLGDGEPYRTAADDDGLTAAGSVLGTPAYMAPEQARGDEIDERVDVFALGAVIYELATGRAQRGPDPIAELRAHRVDADLIAIVTRCLAPARVSRYRDAGELGVDLKRFVAGRRVRARAYGLGDVIAHWIQRHRRVALAAAVALIAVAAVTTIAAYQLGRERDRVTAALAEARRQRELAIRERDRAIDSEAEMLVATDPTRADRLLAAEPPSPQRALLRSRAAAAGVATLVVESRFRIDDSAVDSAFTTLLTVGSDKTLVLTTLADGRSRSVDTELTEPPLLRPAGARWIYVRDRDDGLEVASIDGAGNPEVVARLPAMPLDLAATSRSVYWIDNARNLRAANDDRVLVGKVRAATGFPDAVMVCTESGELLRLDDTGAATALGGCLASIWRTGMAMRGATYVVPRDERTLEIVTGTARRRFAMPASASYYVALDPSGTLAVVDGPGTTWTIRPGDAAATQGPAATGAGYVSAIDGDLAAFGYADGSATVRDVTTGDVWSFKGLPDEVYRVAVHAASRRLVTVGRSQVRVWPIPTASARLLAALPHRAFNVLPVGSLGFVVDNEDGHVRLVAPEPGAPATILHSHSNLAYGLVAVGDEVCSGGFDGKVLCTALLSRANRVVATRPSAVRALKAAGTDLVFADAGGEVWLQSGAAPARRLYEHDGEAYRLAISPDQRWVVSASLDGELARIELATGAVVTARVDGGVRALVWNQRGLWTGDDAGCVQQWDTELRSRARRCSETPVRFLELLPDAVAAVRGQDQLDIDGAPALELAVGERITSASATPSGHRLALAARGAVVFLDLVRATVSAYPIDRADATCVRHVSETEAIICDPSGRILRLRVDDLRAHPWRGTAP